jgi:deoxycytidylate deaminase
MGTVMGTIERPSLESLIMDFAMGLTRRSTCKRAQFSCVIASQDMTQIYGFGYNGTARGFSHDDCKEDQPGNCGCFVSGSLVTTADGPTEIQRVQVGDRVRTHEDRFRRVTRTFRHKYRGGLVELFLDTSSLANMVRRKTATREHPFLTRRGGRTDWLEARHIIPGDYLAVSAKDCPGCGKRIPHYRRMCARCFQESSKGLLVRKQSSARMRRNNPMRGIHIYDPSRAAISQVHLQKDTTRKVYEELLEVKKEYEAKGWRCIVVDHCVRPDIVGIRNDEVIGIEYDRKLWPDKAKYDRRPDVREQYDDIVWHGKHDATYDKFTEGFVWSKVSMVRTRAVDQPVFNLEVAEDNSYVAQRAVVHNCVHAEINALIKVRVNDPQKVVFITGQPCATCAKAIINSGASKVYYRSAYRSNDGLDLVKKAGIELERV